MGIRKLILLLVLYFPFHSKAREYPMLHYGIEDGLPSNTIYDIYQDPDGFIWIGTDKGVARYNGQKFETFTTADGLSDNECFFFQPDHYGRLWIGTFNGELCYYKDGVFHNAKNTPWLKLPFKASATTELNVHFDSSITICLRDDPGFNEIKGEKISHHYHPYMETKFLINSARHITKTSKDMYDILYYDEKMIFDPVKKKIETKKYPDYKLTCYFQSRSKGFLITDSEYIFSDDFKPLSLKNGTKEKFNHIYKIYRNAETILATDKGAVFDSSTVLLPNMNIYSVLVDKNGDYWLATAKNGIYKFNSQFKNAQRLKTREKEPVIFAAKTQNNILYSSKDRSAFYLNLVTEEDKCILDYEKFPQKEGIVNSVHWLENDNYYNFSYEDNYKISGISKNQKIHIRKLNIGNLWGSYKTLVSGKYQYFKCTNIIFYYLKDELTGKGYSAQQKPIIFHRYKRVNNYAIATDSDNNIWFSTINAVFKLKDSSAFIQVQFGNSGFREFLFTKKYFLGINHNNELLISENYRHSIINRNGSKAIFDTIKSNDCVWDKFYKINDSTILISTNNYFRILTIHSNPNEIKYDIRLLENPFIPYQPEYLLLDSGQVYFFKNGQLSTFPLSYILQKEATPNLKFLFFKTEKTKTFIKDTILLDYYLARNIKIDFTPISFYHKNLQYEYSINAGGKDNWNITTGEELNLIKIGYGNFIIKVRAKTMSGQYSKPIAFTLIIKKPFWATYWFIGIVALLIISLIAFIARWSIKRNLRKKENEVRFLRSEYKALNALMNPHFIFNSLNSVQSLVNNNENSIASKYIRIFSDLIRQNMRNISQDLIPLCKELSLVENYLRIEQLRFKSKLSFEINIDDNVETELILIPPLLIQPLVENAIKHGLWPLKSRDGNLKISICEKEEILFIEIIDNGVGLKKKTSDTMHESYAMGNIYKRIEQLSQIHGIDIKVDIQEIHDETGNVSGVKAEITIHTNNHA